VPSPFPGMDPFSEDTDIFPDFHDSLITYLREINYQQPVPPPALSENDDQWVRDRISAC